MDKLYHRLLRTFIVIIITLSFYFIAKYTIIFLYPIIIAVFVSIFLHPIVTFVEVKWRWKRNIATLLIMILFFKLIGFFSFVIFKILLNESSALVNKLPEFLPELTKHFFEVGKKIIRPIYERLSIFFPSMGTWESVNFNYYYEIITDYLTSISTDFIKNILTMFTTIFTSITYIGTISVFVLLAIYILTKDMNFFLLQCKKWIPTHVINKMNTILLAFKKTTLGFFKSQIIIAFISSIIIFVFLLILPISHVLTITIIIFFVDFIPYVGIGFIFIPWILFLFITGDYLLTIQLASLYIFVIIIRQIIEPKIIASSIGIHPIFSLTILFVSFQLWGLFGIVLTPIILIGISTLYHTRILHYAWKFITE